MAGMTSKVRDGEDRDLVKKDTPKKDEDSRAGTPTPKKIGSRAGTPTMTPKKTGTVPRPPSPLKQHVMEAEVQDVKNKVTSTPIEKLPIRILSKCGGGVEVKSESPMKNGVPNKSVATSEPATTPKKVESTIMMVVNETAPRKSQEDQNDKENFAGAGNEEEGPVTTHTQNATPTRPKRGPSFNMGDMMAGLRTSTPQPPIAEDRSGAEGMPTPLRKAAAKLYCTTPIPQPKENSTATQTTSLPNYSTATHVLDQPHTTPPLQAAALSTTSRPARKKVTFQQSAEPPSSKLPRPIMARRAGTDPLVYTAMREEMAKLSESLGRTSVGRVPREAEVDTNGFFYEDEKKHDELVISKSPGDVVGAMRKPPETVTPEKKKSEKYLTTPGPGYTPTRVRSSPAKFRTNIAGDVLAQGEGEIGIHEDKELGEALPNSNVPGGLADCLRKPKGSSPTKSSKVSTPKGKKMAPPGPTSTPARPSPAKTKPAVTIPQASRTSMFKSPLRSRTNTSPSPTSTAQVKAPKAAIPRRQKKEDSGRPVFASALDIANRVAEWNSVDRLKDAKHARKSEGTPSRMQKGSRVKKEGTAKKEMDKEKKVTAKTDSFTPPGSPVKRSATETTTGAGKEDSAPLPATKPALATTTPRHASTFTPRRIAPKPSKFNTPNKSTSASKQTTLPAKQNPTLSRLRAPRTPAAKKMNKSVGDAVNDPNAYRTPSKEIEKSLDEAINRKLADDKRHWQL
jgi:hypothetical protein